MNRFLQVRDAAVLAGAVGPGTYRPAEEAIPGDGSSWPIVEALLVIGIWILYLLSQMAQRIFDRETNAEWEARQW